MTDNPNSESVEMYLKSVAELGGEHEPVPIGRVADRLGISPVSANEMMKRLGEHELIDHEPYKGVTLTHKGRQLANSVIRRQRLWECFLVNHLKLDWAKAHDLACHLEHATAPEVADALAAYLDHPTHCPHGNPIPDPDGESEAWTATPLSELKVGQMGLIRAILPGNSQLFSYLANKGLRPGQKVSVAEAAPLQGPLTLQLGPPESGEETIVGLNLAELVLVARKVED